VPASRGLCRDATVNGAPFCVMDFVDGRVLNDRDAAADMPAAERRGLGEHVVEVLARLHALDPTEVGLGDLGRHDAYLARQIKRWTRQWQATVTHPLTAMDDCARLLAERMPAQDGVAIVHGDYRLGNFIVGDGRVHAVLDWELCTLGDRMADVAYLLNTWVTADEAIPGVDERMPTTAGGFMPRDALLERYARASGRDVSHIDYYRAFAYWRIAAIRQGVYKRYIEGAMGTAHDVDVDGIGASVARCAAAALALLER
jgi:aminoglycoside phosphotransferase (APT) family kinase protein